MVLETPRKIVSEPDFVKEFSDCGQILQVQFSPYEWSQDLLLIAFKEKILLAHLDLNDSLDIKILTVFAHISRCTTLCISPETTLNAIPNVVSFCAGGIDFNLRIFKSDLLEDNICKVLTGHSSYINDSAFDPENNYLVSASDDNTVKVWTVDDLKLKCTFSLSSPGINVCWHRMDSGKLLVAEKIGLIRFYNVESETCIFSSDYSKSLSSCHWAPSDKEVIASLHSGELLIWELPNRCLPLHKSIFFSENGGNIKFSPQGELVAAVNSLEGSLKILHVKSQAVKLAATVTLTTNVTWHYRYPLVCVGDDYNLCFWKVTPT